MHLRKGVIFWVPTHAPQPLISCPGSVSTFFSYHARGSPLGVALSWVVSVPRSPSGGVGSSWVRLPPTSIRTMALKPPFCSLYYCSEVLRPLVVSPPPRSFLPMGIGGLHRRCLNLATPYPSGTLTWRRLISATPTPGDASSWRRLHLATPYPGDALTWRRLKWSIRWLSSLGPLRGRTIRWLLTLTLVNARGRDDTITILVLVVVSKVVQTRAKRKSIASKRRKARQKEPT